MGFTSWPADTAADNHVYIMASRHYSQPHSRHCSRQSCLHHGHIGRRLTGEGSNMLQYATVATLHHLLPIVNAEVPQPAAGPGNAFKIKAVIKPKTVSDLGS